MEEDDGLPSEGEFIINYEDLEFGTKIGRGQYGHVYKGEYLGTSVAIKQCVFEGQDRDMMKKYIAREISVLKDVRHPNIVNFIGICKRTAVDSKGEETIYIITEWVPNGNLQAYARSKAGAHITWAARVNMAIDIAAAMAFLHQKNLIHRDLKSENLLITENGRIKLCDFGFARLKARGRLMTLAGTEEYMAPEVTLGEDYGEKCDVYGRQPPHRGPATCFDFRPEDLAAVFPSDCPEAFKLVAIRCVQYSAKSRPSFKEILQQLKALREELNYTPARSTHQSIKSTEAQVSRPFREPMAMTPGPSVGPCERTAQDREDERGPEFNFDEGDEDKRTETERELERGPEICLNDEDQRTETERELERGPEICLDGEDERTIMMERELERGPEICPDDEDERTERERELERGLEVDLCDEDDQDERELKRGPEIRDICPEAAEEEGGGSLGMAGLPPAAGLSVVTSSGAKEDGHLGRETGPSKGAWRYAYRGLKFSAGAGKATGLPSAHSPDTAFLGQGRNLALRHQLERTT